jgi:hypothetical protein
MIRIYNNFDIKILKKYKKIKDYKDKSEIKWYWRSPCNCIGDIKHNDGGNYHTILMLYKFDFENKEIYILVKSDTRDKCFSNEDTKKYVFYLGENHYYFLLELEEWEDINFYEIVEF